MMNLTYPTVERIMNVTEFKSELLAKGALEALKWFDTGAPHKYNGIESPVFFDMKNYVKPSNRGTTCGTACCIAGAIALHAGLADPDRECGHSSIKRHFNFDPDETGHVLTRLFYPMRPGARYVIDYKTPAQAAKTLRHYLFTGEVDWKSDAE